jgi:hypothetical protein
MKIGQKGLLFTPGRSESVPARACALGAAFSVFTVFFITWSIFGFFQLFLNLNLLEHTTEKNEYEHNIVGLTVWPGSPLLRFGNCKSLNVGLSRFQLLRQDRSLALFISTWKNSFSVRLSQVNGAGWLT